MSTAIFEKYPLKAQGVEVKKHLFSLFASILLICLACLFSCGEDIPEATDGALGSETDTQVADTDELPPKQDDRDISVLSYDDIIKGVEHGRGEHVANGINSVLELDRRAHQKMVSKHTGSAKTYYPRLKVLSDGTYMLIYQDGRWGPNIFYKTSADFETWSEPKLLFGSCAVDGDVKKFATADAVVMPDGEIIVVCTYLSDRYYTTKNTYNGIMLKRSSDNGKTWSDMEKIYGATNWEPDILLRDDGELQIYFSHTGPYIELYGYHDKRSSGTAILRSNDGGHTWTPDTSKAPYEAWRVLQIPVGTYKNQPYFTGQMPVAVQLHNGDMMVAVETQYLDSACYISVGYSKDNWKNPLALTQSGPAEMKVKMWGGVAPYLVQFDSGEVVLSYVTVTDGLMKLRVASSDGRSFSEPNSVFDGISTGLWSSVEVIDDHTLGIVSDYQPKLSSGETTSYLSVGRAHLNHAFSATKGQKITVDGDNSDWKCGVEGIFIGSESQAQATLRVSEDEENVYILIDRLDSYLSDKDTFSLFVSDKKGEYYSISVGCEGIEKISRMSGGKFTSIDAGKLQFASFIGGTLNYDKDTDQGYVIELAIPKSMLDLSSRYIGINLAMANSDKGKSSQKDDLTPTKMSNTDSWIRVFVL